MNIEYHLKRDYIINLISKGKRLDNRRMDEMRPIEIIKGFVGEKASGSAYVKLGKTEVLAGISADIGEPYPDSPTSGVMSTSAEFRPIASPYFEAGPPREDAIELARVVDRGIRESGTIDLESLFIEEEKVWVIYIDIHVLNNDGNLIDASAIAAIAALTDARLPKIENGNIVRGEWSGKLPIRCIPIPITFGKISSSLVRDTTLDEEYSTDARLTVTTTDTINAIQKGGPGSFTADEIKFCVRYALEKAPELRALVEK